MSAPAAPEGYATVNPFIITTDADELTRFVIEVFGGEERAEARTIDEDGLLLQAEVRVGTTTVMLAERKPDWPFTPSLLQVYVDDLDAVLERALERGARLVTKPTDFFGTQFARVQDASANLWWIWQHGDAVWDAQDGEGEWGAEGVDEGWGEVSPELAYIHDTLLEAMTSLRDPRSSRH
ncbi:glyoxalase [Agromyces mediolanus]|uniref:VOC family protein n=1 Tax=Agromyces mediolanus TaxID=41986 RepID=UPI0020403CF8|nr:VOC family protein [Agromyces mediolanus]MCM3656130.1 glyoxalase [Agromyces mediolanus]